MRAVQELHAEDLLIRLRLRQGKSKTLRSANLVQRRINRVNVILSAIRLGKP